MGRKTKSKQTKKKPKVAKVKSSNQEQGYSVENLLEQAETCVDSFNYELAQKFCERALELEPENLSALEMSGTLWMEIGDMDAAKQCLCRAVELSPDSGHSKYMYLGQLLTGKDAAESFLQGVTVMKKQLEEQQAEEAAASAQQEPPVTVRDISSAYCSIAEIYMTDACFEDDAEAQCKQCLDQALNTDPANPEAHHLLASYWLCKEDTKAAEESIEKGLSLWLPQLKQAEEKKQDFDPIEACSIGYPSRVNAVKTVIELKKYDVATEILELLLDEDDTIVEVWYLLGWAHYLQGEDYKNTARHYLQKAHEVAKKTKCEDEGILSHLQELLEELGPAPEDDGAGDSEAGDEDGEMDIDGSSDGEGEGVVQNGTGDNMET